MKQPNSPLTWQIGECLNTDDKSPLIVDIEDKDENVICTLDNKGSLQDAEYIVEACNNYPTAMKLLKRVYQIIPVGIKSYIDELEKEVGEFLINKYLEEE